MLQLWATLLLLFGLLAYSSATSCSGHVRELKYVGRREPSYVIKSSSKPYISDSTLPAGWYFAKDSARYYTLVNGTAPAFAHCGTYNPIYIKDKLGELDEGKEYQLTACLLDFNSSCQHRYSIKIRKCGQQIQYYLLPTDGTSAYCFERSSFPVEEPAPDYIIPDNIRVSVALMYRRENNSLEPELDFKCNFGSASNRYYYGVSWVIDGRIEKTFAPVKVNDVDGTNLNETTLGRLGFKFGLSIQCAVKVSSTATGDQTIPQMSDTFYAGIKVLTPQITLNSGSPKSILVLPTIPLGCRRPDGLPDTLEEPCDLDIEMIDTNTKYSCQDTSLTSLRNQNLCGSKITGWRNATSQPCMHSHNAELCSYSSIKRRLTTTSIQIAASNDQLQYPTDKTFTVQLKTGNTAPHSFWEDVQLDDVTVRYTGGSQNNKWKGKICSVVNYPTLATFDGSGNWPYQSYINESGHYLLYKNTESLAEVQIKTQLCGADSSLHSYTSSCTCAAAIQAGGDVFLIDICSEIKRAEFTHRRGNVLNVREVKDSQYELDVNGTVIHSDKHDRDGEYKSMFDGNCCPSAVEKRRKKRDVNSNTFTVRYSVSISNDGIHYGPSRNVHVFDSTCQSYVKMPKGDLIFSLKTDTCYIDSQCYRDGERSLERPFLICCPFVTSYEWTNPQDCVPPTSNQENGGERSNLGIVAVSVSVSGIFLVAGVVVFAIWTYKSKKRSVWTVTTTKTEPPKFPDYTELDFSNVKFESGEKAVFQPNN